MASDEKLSDEIMATLAAAAGACMASDDGNSDCYHTVKYTNSGKLSKAQGENICSRNVI